MFRIDDATAATSLPVPEAAATEGFFTEGSPTAGTPATRVKGSWLNMIQEELCAVLAAAGIARSKTSYNQVNAALQKMYSPVVGSVRNLSANLPATGASVAFTADEIIVETALGGQTYRLASLNKTLNLATVGPGGMDVGTAPAGGTLAIYAGYNPSAALSATNPCVFAQSVGTGVASNVYTGGAAAVAAYTATALISALLVSATAGQLLPFGQADRKISGTPFVALSTTTTVGQTALIVALPANAIRMRGSVQVGSTVTSVTTVSMYDTAAGLGPIQIGFTSLNASGGGSAAPFDMKMSAARTAQYAFSTTGGGGTANIIVTVSGYEI